MTGVGVIVAYMGVLSRGGWFVAFLGATKNIPFF